MTDRRDSPADSTAADRPTGGIAVIEVTWDDTGRARVDGARTRRFGFSAPDEHGEETGCVAGWRLENEVLVLESDLHGYRPLAWWVDAPGGVPRRAIASNAPWAIARRLERARLDPIAIATLLRAGFICGERTTIDGVERVPPATRIRVGPGGIERARTADRWFEDGWTDVRTGIDGLVDRFRTAIARRRPPVERWACPLSGGRDSRMLLAELLRVGERPVELVTHDPGPGMRTEDLEIAIAIAERAGLPLRRIGLPSSGSAWIEAEIGKHRACDGESLEHTWFAPLWNDLADAYDCWYDGLGAGVCTRSDLNRPGMDEPFRRGDFATLARELFACSAAPGDAWATRLEAAIGLVGGGEEAAIEAVRAAWEPLADAPNPLSRFGFEHWNRRGIALSPYGIGRVVPNVIAPLMDRDVVAWLGACPLAVSRENDIQTDACRIVASAFDDVPFETHAPPRGRRRDRAARLTRRLARMRYFLLRGRRFRSLAMPILLRGGDSFDERALGAMIGLDLLLEHGDA